MTELLDETLHTDESTNRPGEFRAGKAALVLLLVLLAQVAVGFISVVVGVVVALVSKQNLNDEKVKALLGHVSGSTLIVSSLATAGVILLLARAWAWDETRDRTERGIGLRTARVQDLGISAILGILLATSYLLVSHFLFPPRAGIPLGPLTQLAGAHGFDYVAWILLAVILAPPVEEFLFRGLLLKGFSRSWGVVGGAIAVTTIFVLMHAFETAYYWPAAVGILALALATLAVRLHSGSLGPAIALHAAYNLALVTYASGVLRWPPPAG